MRLKHILLSGACLIFPMATFANIDENISEQDISAAIIGGETTTLNQLPFFARIILHKTGENQFANICGGSIVNDRFILTAAHCVQSDVFSGRWSVNDLRVLVKNPTMDDVYLSEFKDVRRIIIHPNYSESDLWINDLALLELSYPIIDNVQSITLPQDFGDYSNVSTYQIFGLGTTSTYNLTAPNYLRWAEVKPLTDSECAAMVSGFHSEESLCTTSFDNREYSGICGGDSGGPLTYVDDKGIYQQIGIVSYGASVCESAAIPDVFTEILNYTSWIEQHTSSGMVTRYDANLTTTESYHSAGDSGNVEELFIEKNNSSSGGGIGTGLLIFGACLGWVRRRKPD